MKEVMKMKVTSTKSVRAESVSRATHEEKADAQTRPARRKRSERRNEDVGGRKETKSFLGLATWISRPLIPELGELSIEQANCAYPPPGSVERSAS